LSIGEEIKTNFSSFHVHSSRASLRKFRQPSKSCVEWSSTNVIISVFVYRKVVFRKLLSKLSRVCLTLKKLINEKHFPVNEKHFYVKEKFSLISRKVFSFYFGLKTLSRSCEKFKNIILFVDYVKFGPQTFDCYIFCLNFFFSNSSLKIWFNLIFILTLILIFMIVIYFSLIIFLIEIFYLSNLILILLIITYFI